MHGHMRIQHRFNLNLPNIVLKKLDVILDKADTHGSSALAMSKQYKILLEACTPDFSSYYLNHHSKNKTN